MLSIQNKIRMKIDILIEFLPYFIHFYKQINDKKVQIGFKAPIAK